jgi:hypothetical protein
MTNDAVQTCDGCAERFTPDQLVSLGGRLLCGACKADAVMNMKSGLGAGARITPEEAQAVRSRIRKLNLLSFAFALPGLFLQFGSQVVQGQPAPPEEALARAGTSVLIKLVGVILLIAGLTFYAKMRGRNGAFGLLGLLSCIGFLILYFLSKRCLHCGTSHSYRTKECGACGAPLGA